MVLLHCRRKASWFDGAIYVAGDASRQLAQTAKRNRKKCNQLKERVDLISAFLRELRKLQCTPDRATTTMLQSLEGALCRGEILVQFCQHRKKGWNRLNVFSGHKKSVEFADLHKSISNIMQLFPFSNLIHDHTMNNERFLMNVLDKLLSACKDLPHDKKKDLKASISNLTNCEHMSPEAKGVLELIKSKLSGAAASTTTSSFAGGGRGWHPRDDDITVVAQDIVGEAETVKQNKEEAQWLAGLAQQVVYLMQHPQVPLIREHPYASRLKDDLEEALCIIRSRDMHRSIPAMMVPMPCVGGGECSGSYSKMRAIQISKVGYRIEHYLQVFPIITISRIINA